MGSGEGGILGLLLIPRVIWTHAPVPWAPAFLSIK